MRLASRDARAMRLARSATARGRGVRARASRGTSRRALDAPDDDEDGDDGRASRRVALGVVAAAVATTRSANAMDATARAFLDVGACEGIVNAARALGDDGGALCATPNRSEDRDRALATPRRIRCGIFWPCAMVRRRRRCAGRFFIK